MNGKKKAKQIKADRASKREKKQNGGTASHCRYRYGGK